MNLQVLIEEAQSRIDSTWADYLGWINGEMEDVEKWREQHKVTIYNLAWCIVRNMTCEDHIRLLDEE